MGASDPTDLFVQQWTDTGFAGSDLVREYVLGDSPWRFDLAFPSQKLVIEIHGFGFGHQRQAGLIRDCDKINWVAANGWRIMVFTTAHLSSQEKRERVVHDVCEVLSTI